MAEVPAPTLIGVRGVVIACEIDPNLTPEQSRTLCAQLVRKARVATSLPVKAAAEGDAKPRDLASLAEQLLLRIKISAKPTGANRKTLTLTVTPVRLAVKQGQVGPVTSSATLVKAGPDWLVQGHIDAFSKLLGGAPRELQRPIRSDNSRAE